MKKKKRAPGPTLHYDPEANAAYLYFRPFKDGETVDRSESFEIEGVKSMLVADFDSNGYVIGIEILPADNVLSKKTLKGAVRP